MAVRDELRFEGFDVSAAADGESGMRMALELRPDVLLLDLMLPGRNGFEVCRSLRSELRDTWIVLLTARGQEADRVTGFEAGADDYVVKPFSLRELVARVKVGLRRHSPPSQPNALRLGDMEIDVRGRRVTRSGQEVRLTRKEFDLLALLAGRAGTVIARDEICDLLWGEEVYVTQRVVDTHIAALRRKIEADPNNPSRILGVRGVGYKIDAY